MLWAPGPRRLCPGAGLAAKGRRVPTRERGQCPFVQKALCILMCDRLKCIVYIGECIADCKIEE